MKKLFLIIIILAAFGMLGIQTANAIPVKFQMVDLFGWGSTYTYNPLGPTWVTDAFNPNPYYGTVSQNIPAPGLNPPPWGVIPDGTEDSFTIQQVERLTSPDGLTVYWDRSTSGQELTVFAWGFDDVYLSNPGLGGNYTLAAIGGVAEMWLDVSPDYDPNVGTGGRSNLVDPTFFQNVTDDGILVLSLAARFLPDPTLLAGGYSLFESSAFPTQAYTGSMLIDVTGGLWGPLFDTNSQVFGADLSYSFSSTFNYPSPPGPGVADWLVYDDSTAYGNMIPEPATMLLLGSGLIGLAGFARRRFKK